MRLLQVPPILRSWLPRLGLLAVLTVWSGPSYGQPAEPVPPPRPRGDETVSVGESILLKAESGKEIKQVVASRPNIVELKPVAMQPAVIQVTGVSVGDTRVAITDVDNRVTTVQVRVEPDINYIRTALARQFPRANLTLTPGAEGVYIVGGTVESIEDIEPILAFMGGFAQKTKIINNLKVGGVMQVQLEVCVARVSRSELRRMGFNWLWADQQNLFGSTIGDLILTPDRSPRAGVGTFSGDFLTPAANIFFEITDETSEFLGFIQALRREGLAKVLATPTLTTFSGRPAEFLVGGEQPYPIPAALGQPPGIEFKPFGTRLQFLPVVLGNGRIRLDVAPEVSRLNFANGVLVSGSQVPQFETQRLHATVELENGQTLALGGLLQNEVNALTNKVPVLGDLPFFGWAWRTVSYEEVETELLVLVTPRLVDPMDCGQRMFKLPGQETRTPTDFELFLEGILEAPRGPRELCPDGKYRTSHWDGSEGGWGHRGHGGAGCHSGSGAPCGTPPAHVPPAHQGHAAMEAPMPMDRGSAVPPSPATHSLLPPTDPVPMVIPAEMAVPPSKDKMPAVLPPSSGMPGDMSRQR